MNFLVGLLLLAVERDCVRCFWLMVVLLEQVSVGGLSVGGVPLCGRDSCSGVFAHKQLVVCACTRHLVMCVDLRSLCTNAL